MGRVNQARRKAILQAKRSRRININILPPLKKRRLEYETMKIIHKSSLLKARRKKYQTIDVADKATHFEDRRDQYQAMDVADKETHMEDRREHY